MNWFISVFLLFFLHLLSAADGSAITFDGYTTSQSVNYQLGSTTTYSSTCVSPQTYTVPGTYGNLWSVVDEWGLTGMSLDEEVADMAGNPVLRISNAGAETSFSDQPWSPSAGIIAGETGAELLNDRGTCHSTPTAATSRGTASTNFFHFGFSFGSWTGAAQTGLDMAISPGARQSSVRLSQVRLLDNGSGIEVSTQGRDSL